jgi:hypothetical protein
MVLNGGVKCRTELVFLILADQSNGRELFAMLMHFRNSKTYSELATCPFLKSRLRIGPAFSVPIAKLGSGLPETSQCLVVDKQWAQSFGCSRRGRGGQRALGELLS